MLILSRCTIAKSGAALFAVLALSAFGSVQQAAAENFFETLFGGFQRRMSMPQQSNSDADPSGGETSGGYGHGTAYCVRTCDGRYFPIQRHAGVTPAELCHSFCPAAQTVVFSGSKIDTAVAQNGARYADIDTAFAYRNRLVANCTCNGKDGGGLARLDTATDPTLRSGDIVATNDGLATYNGKTAEFTPINPASGEWARRLAEVKVRPAPPQDTSEVAAAPMTNDDPKPVKRTRRGTRYSATE
ncbi:DUF2865 domain-containing protein [Rhodoplanes sp. Z2-YC6860]|uniref:DUF2865 domain-containing protein n=1 Tax=Rhodoplanes sp. Z2-YC6860 TaxID=674703 RepID=UPI00078C4BE4|nr:DUF2865 domain-containing protein [Rhodoplanes sp. Z2-YC6860]AMN45155.1 hypothetical protein RHPLAN_67490 [Rhodoplanes sp. Z2-YC6860]